MNQNEKRNLVFSLIGLATLVVSVIGMTYAYYTATIISNEPSESINVKAGKLTINYENGKNLILDDPVLPQAAALGTKEFSIVGSNNTDLSMPYFLELHVTKNEFLDNAIEYTLQGVKTQGSGTPVNISTKTGIPKGVGVYQLGTQANFLMGESKHQYILTVYFDDKPGVDQSGNLGAKLEAYVQISGEPLTP